MSDSGYFHSFGDLVDIEGFQFAFIREIINTNNQRIALVYHLNAGDDLIADHITEEIRKVLLDETLNGMEKSFDDVEFISLTTSEKRRLNKHIKENYISFTDRKGSK